jgi:hypothetical protein
VIGDVQGGSCALANLPEYVSVEVDMEHTAVLPTCILSNARGLMSHDSQASYLIYMIWTQYNG